MKWKKWLFLVFLICASSYAGNYQSVDQKVRNYPYFKSLEHLSIRIMNDFRSDEDRVRAAFIWIVYNMDYGKSYDVIFQADRHFPYYSEIGKRYQLRQIEIEKIDKSFRDRLGVCLDYSLILKELCTYFRIPSEIIIGVTKTEIRDLEGDQLLKNHTWNAVQLNGEWKLMDPTWASGQLNKRMLMTFGTYIDHYFLSDPQDFIKSHFPANPVWQLLDQPIDAKTFSQAPSYYPAYFDKEVELSAKTNGIIRLSDYEDYIILFDKLPASENMHYQVSESRILKKMDVYKAEQHPYVSVIKLRKKLKNPYSYLTVFIDYRPILKFKIDNNHSYKSQRVAARAEISPLSGKASIRR